MFCCCKREKEEEINTELDLEENLIKKKLQLLENPIYLEAEKHEKIILTNSNLDLVNQLEIKNIFINNSNSEWLHTYVCGNQDKVKYKDFPYVLIHGYGQSSANFCKIIQKLSEERITYCIDLIGMGLSSRPKLDLTQSSNEILDIFINSIENWRKAVKIDKLILIGHSIGGYFSGIYATQYPQNIVNLHCISPIGVTIYDEQGNLEYEQNLTSNMNFFKKYIYSKGRKLWDDGEIYQEQTVQQCMAPTSLILYIRLKKRFKLDGQLYEAYKKYLYSMYSLNPSTSKCLNKLFMFPTFTGFISLYKEFHEKYQDKIVNFYYGDKDWVDCSGAKKLINENLVQGTFTLIENSDHNIQFENPEQLIEKIMENDKIILQNNLQNNKNVQNQNDNVNNQNEPLINQINANK